MDFNSCTYQVGESIELGLIASDAQKIRAFGEYVRERQDTSDFPIHYSDNFPSDICSKLFNLEIVYGEEYKDCVSILNRSGEYHLHMSLARLRWLFEVFPKQKPKSKKPFFDFLTSQKVSLSMLLNQYNHFAYLLSCMRFTEQIMRLNDVRAKNVLYVKFQFTGNMQGATLQGDETKAFLDHLSRLEQATMQFEAGARVTS